MNFLFKNEVVDYDYFGTGNQTILFLHGWGGNKNSFISTINILKYKFKILTITIPTISPTTLSWTMDNYKDLVLSILKSLNIKSVVIVCHSFGLRVVSKIKDFVNIEKLIITGGAGPTKTNFIKQINKQNRIILLRQKRFNFLFKLASEDYKTLSKANKTTFKNIVNLNTKNLLTFNCPTLLFWGSKDTETKLWIAKLIKKQNNSKLITLKSDHFAYIHYNSLFNHNIIKFLSGEK